jgi:hypothetical protein
MECRDIMSGDSTVAGQLCIQVISQDGTTYLNVSYAASEDWTFVAHEFWVSDDYEEIPFDEDGSLDVENFPFYWCNSTGEQTWVSKVELKWEYNCEEASRFNLAIVSRSTFGQLLEDGTIVEDSEVTAFVTDHVADSADGMYGWFDLELNCECPPTEICVPYSPETPELPLQPTEPSTPEICIETEDNSMEECHDILAGDSLIAGTVCTKVVEEPGSAPGEDAMTMLEITFTASEGWTFVTNEIWVGEDISALPLDEDGALDTENFPFFWCNSTGEPTYTTQIPLKWEFNCEDMDNFSLVFLTQSTMAKLLEDGTVDSESEITAFSFEYQGESSEGVYGYYDVKVLCECVEEEDRSPTETEICIETDDGSMQACYSLLAGDSMPAGTVCIEMTDGSLEVSFTSESGYAFVSVEGWIGENLDDIPMDEDGALDTENFPYFWCNSTGITSFVETVDNKWAYNCDEMKEFSLSLVAHATIAKILEDGTVEPESELSAFAFEH